MLLRNKILFIKKNCKKKEVCFSTPFCKIYKFILITKIDGVKTVYLLFTFQKTLTLLLKIQTG